MQINGPGQIHGPQSVHAPHRVQASETPAAETSFFGEADQVDISQQADLISRVRELPDVRAERVAQIRAAIDAGRYETLDKLDLALDRLLEEIG